MSSKMQIKKKCECCGKTFTAQKTTTRYCSHKCNSKAYKQGMNDFLSLDELNQMLKEFDKRKRGISAIISPVLEKYNLDNKEILEVCQVGKLLWNMNSSYHIYDKPKPPHPDFILKNEFETIGLEHTRLMTEYAPQYFRLKNLIDDSAKIFENKYNEKIFATINFMDDNFSFKKSDRPLICENIADYIHSILTKQKGQKPKYISDVRIQKHTLVNFSYEENDWKHIPLDKHTLEKNIKKKEAKIKLYQQAGIILGECWLILVIDSSSSASYEYDENINYKTESIFDRIFLYRDFYEEIIEVK